MPLDVVELTLLQIGHVTKAERGAPYGQISGQELAHRRLAMERGEVEDARGMSE